MKEDDTDKTRVLGIMSGTSLDGLDMAICCFEPSAGNYAFKIESAVTLEYTPEWKARLAGAKELTAEQYFRLHAEYGRFIGQEINRFIDGVTVRPYIVASHGHTVFHQPQNGFSTQLGCGATIAAETSIDTVCDFRSLDVALGGQGAPLVPVGDHLLFGSYRACLNLGGIANISYRVEDGARIAYDICVANMLLNDLSLKLGKAYDKGGQIAAGGKVDPKLLTKLNSLAYYSQKGARSIGREWYEKNIMADLGPDLSIADQLATGTEHIAIVIAGVLNGENIKEVLVTGGGAFNDHLISRIRAHSACRLVIPDAHIVNFKEALIFAFLGYLRINSVKNTLASVTGAGHDSIGGALYLGGFT